jgi:hypothetical protein
VKAASSTLIAFLDSAATYARADFYTITLVGGQVLRYWSGPGLMNANGFTFGQGPLVKDSGVKSTRGVEVSEIDITFSSDTRFLVNGVVFLDFVENLGLDGALVLIERGFSTDFASMRSAGPIGGTYIRFSGRFSEAKDLGMSQVTVTCASPLDLFTNNVPPDCFQTSCANVLGDGKCLVNLPSLGTNYTVANTLTPTQTQWQITGTLPPTGDYSLGKVKFTSGANSGRTVTIKSQDAAGVWTTVVPLPAAPAVGDTFTAYPGCDLSTTRCVARFNNIIHYRGEPFIPDPATGLPS